MGACTPCQFIINNPCLSIEREKLIKEKKMTKQNRTKLKTFKFKYFNSTNIQLNLKLKHNVLQVEAHKV